MSSLSELGVERFPYGLNIDSPRPVDYQYLRVRLLFSLKDWNNVTTRLQALPSRQCPRQAHNRHLTLNSFSLRGGRKKTIGKLTMAVVSHTGIPLKFRIRPKMVYFQNPVATASHKGTKPKPQSAHSAQRPGQTGPIMNQYSKDRRWND